MHIENRDSPSASIGYSKEIRFFRSPRKSTKARHEEEIGEHIYVTTKNYVQIPWRDVSTHSNEITYLFVHSVDWCFDVRRRLTRRQALNRGTGRTSGEGNVRQASRLVFRDMRVRRHEVTGAGVFAVLYAGFRTEGRVFESTDKFVSNVFTTDNVQVEIDAIVEVRQQIEDFVCDLHIVLEFHVTGVKDGDMHELDNVQTRSGNMEKKIDRCDDHQHARDFVDELHLLSGIAGRIAVIGKRTFLKEFVHD